MSATRKKVLWVDDEIEFLRSHIMFLETRGYTVTPVFSGDDAIEVLREKPHEFDIVLLDEQMPGKDGLTTLEEIKEMLPDLPVVMVTKSEEEQLMEDALGKKIDGYLTKPVNPSQILSVCKNLLDSRSIISNQVTQRYTRHYSDVRNGLRRPLTSNDWIRLHANLTYWDFELENIDNEGLRQSHAGQKSDANAVFAQFVTDNYALWARDAIRRPVMSPDVVRTYVAPLLAKGEKVYFVVLDCMRLDQYIAIETVLRKHFDIERHCFFSVLPTATSFARNALLAGEFPADAMKAWPGIITDPNADSHGISGRECDMLRQNLKKGGTDIGDTCTSRSITDAASAAAALDDLRSLGTGRLNAIIVNFMDMLTQGHSTSALLQEIAPDESAFRALTASWFQYSSLYQILRELSRQEAAVVLTTDHGSILCSRGTEFYGKEEVSPHLRAQYGVNITGDERHVLYVPVPDNLRLPSSDAEGVWVLARENYYFIRPAKFEDYQDQYRSSFCYGGISMDEMIVPLAVMRGKKQ